MRSLLACLLASLFASVAAIAAPQPDPRPAAPSNAPGSVVMIVRHVQVCRASSVGVTAAPVDFSMCTRMPTERVNPQGTALWMLADVTLPASMAEQREPMAVLVQSMASSAIYWDGVPIGSSGIVSIDPRREVPGQFVHVVPLRTEEARAGVHRLAIALSSHHGPVRVDSPMHVVVVAPLDVVRDGIGAAPAATLVALGALLLAAAYFATVAGRVNPRRDALLLAVMITCALVQSGAELLRLVVPLTYVAQIWRLIVILLAAIGLGAALVAYVTRRFAPTWQRRLLASYGIAAGLTWFVPGFDLRTFVVLGVAVALALGVAVRAAWQRHSGARSIAAVLVLLLAVGGIEGSAFLDRDLFVGITILTLLLLLDQVATLQRAQRAAVTAQRTIERLELELLRRRLTPHWLLNMLNALTAWIEEEPRTAVRMVGMLGEEFHRLAQPIDAPLIPLEEELAACARLLELMSLRTGRPFTIDASDVSPALDVPPAVLHTLVENALTHGRYRHGATFRIREVQDAGVTVLTFETPQGDPASDALPGPTPADATDGFGLTYVRARLRAAYGDSATLRHGPRDEGGWRTTIWLGVTSA